MMGAECFWGVDAHSRRVAIGIVGGGNNVACWKTYEIPSLKAKALAPNVMMHELATLLRRSLWTLYSDVGWKPSAVVVEQPIGAHPAPTLMAAWGVTLAAVAEQVECPILEMKPAQWKAAAGLPGNAGKELMLGQAYAELGYKGESEHEADALWMAVAARNRYSASLLADRIVKGEL